MSLSDVRSFFDQKAALWDDGFDELKLAQIRDIFNTYLKPLQSPVLDLGCGTGVLLKIIPECLINPEALILELDFSLPMLLKVRGKALPLEQKVVLVQADGQQLPLAAGSLGDIIAFQVFPHFLMPEKVFKEAQRTLRPKGRFIILHLMNHQQVNALHRKVNGPVSEHFLPPVEDLAEEMYKAGFKIETKIEQENCYLLVARQT